MFRLLQISDLHFGPPFVEHVAESLLRQIPTLNANAIIISGDFTQRATKEQFDQAKKFIERLPDVPCVTVPGNHDIPLYRIFERLFSPLKLYKEYISSDLNTVHHLGEAVIVGLDSTAPLRSLVNGKVTKKQLEFCTNAFKDSPSNAARIVVAHHHFAPAPDNAYDRTMPKSKRAINRFVDLKVDMILGGHLHRAFIGNSLDFYPGNHRDRGIVIVQCGTTTSRRGRVREREKNSFNLIDIDSNMIHVTHHLFFEEDGQFAPFSRTLFPRPGKRFIEADRAIDVLKKTEQHSS